MNGESFGVDLGLGEWLIFMTEKAISKLTRDKLSAEDQAHVESLVTRSVARAGSVMCIGMSHPVPITQVYQPTRLLSGKGLGLGAERLVQENANAVILAGPGRGKTTLLHWLYISLLESNNIYPLLFTLRREGEIDELGSCVDLARSGKLGRKAGKRRLLFLVDGYDEVAEDERARVSKLLNDLAAVEHATYLLTCRLYYDLIDLRASQFQILGFAETDARNFVRAFIRAYGVSFNPDELLADLAERGFKDFLASPLLLTLVCILKCGLQPEIPRRTVPLLRNALDVLRLRWDYEKGVRRESRYPVDGEDRIRCLMRIAFHMQQLEGHDQVVLPRASEFLKLVGVHKVDARDFLLEVARWYGLLVPLEANKWTFTHRTIHDYLAARFWVENGLFNPSSVRIWNTRAAYAASLFHDSTEAIVRALEFDNTTAAVVEILDNNPLYHPSKVAAALLKHYGRYRQKYSVRWPERGHVAAEISQDYFGSMNNELLYSLCMGVSRARSDVTLVLACYALAELVERKEPLFSNMLLPLRASLGESLEVEVKRRLSVTRFNLGKLQATDANSAGARAHNTVGRADG